MDGIGRKAWMDALAKMRADRIAETSAKYEKLPENIRAAVARVAGVENKPLAELSAEDRKKLKQAAKGLVNQLVAAYGLLVAADTSI